jgi:tellurite methyltransferase
MAKKDWSEYQAKTYKDDVCKLLVDFLNTYKVKTAVDLGCGAGNETVYMLKEGINVTAVDKQLNSKFILNRINKEETRRVKFIEEDFQNLDIPSAQLVTAFFSIPFCNPDKFDNLWNRIYNSLETNGYFVGQLFGNRDAWKENKYINTFTIKQIKEYLKRYKIITLDEVEYIRKSDNKKWHYYNIIAQKCEA